MVFRETILRICDNSGAKWVKCIHPMQKARKKAYMGEVIKVSLQAAANRNNLLSKKIYQALIVSTRWPTPRVGGHYIKFDNTRAILLEEGDKFLGTRIYGPICKEVRGGEKEIKFKRVISYAGAIL